jgi:hypothetical protein
MLTAGMFFFISSAKPLEQLSPQRPHPNIFNAYFFLSLCGQMALHMAFLVRGGGRGCVPLAVLLELAAALGLGGVGAARRVPAVQPAWRAGWCLPGIGAQGLQRPAAQQPCSPWLLHKLHPPLALARPPTPPHTHTHLPLSHLPQVHMYYEALGHMPKDERQSSDSDFKPNLVNTVCYLVQVRGGGSAAGPGRRCARRRGRARLPSRRRPALAGRPPAAAPPFHSHTPRRPHAPRPQAVVQLATFAVNYVGHPFNSSLLENKGLLTSLRISAIFLAVLMLQLMPDLNDGFQLVPLPGSMGPKLLALSCGMIVAAGAWEVFLRSTLLPGAPPAKGYMEHEQELARLRARGKKRD